MHRTPREITRQTSREVDSGWGFDPNLLGRGELCYLYRSPISLDGSVLGSGLPHLSRLLLPENKWSMLITPLVNGVLYGLVGFVITVTLKTLSRATSRT